MPDGYFVQSMERMVPIAEYLAACVDVEKFVGYCKACGNYSRRWSCPQFDFDPLDLWKRYQAIHIHARILTPISGVDMAIMMEGMRREKEKLMDALLKMEQDTPGSLALSAGGYSLCGSCTRPEGKPCRRPERMRYSVDALGGDLSETMEQYFQRPIRWSRNGEVPEYLTLVGGLLVGGNEP